jgi:Putative MetA-pathway of phenol degradation
MKISRVLVALVVTALSLPISAHAQNQSATDIVGFLMLNQAVPTADFERYRAAADAARQTIVNALLVNLASVPLSTSSGGFVYRINELLGTAERAGDTFGPFFVERALTPGKGHPSFGLSASSTSFTELDGKKLRDGSLLTISNQFRDEPTPFDTERLTLKIRTSGMTLFGSVPVTDHFELGAALPLVRLELDGARVTVHRGTTLAQAGAEATASGVGDLALRGKYVLFDEEGFGIAAAGELRAPTGDRDNLLGAGKAGYRVSGLASYEPSNVAIHLNLGVAGGGVSNEISLGAAGLVAVSPRVTLSGEMLARRVSELRDLDLVAAPHPTIAGVDTYRLATGKGDNTAVQLVTGIKWNVARTMVVGGHVRWSANHSGLTATLTPTVAFEYAF